MAMPLSRFFLLLFLVLGPIANAQRFSVSLGVYSGITACYTADKGIEKDPRYEERFEAKMAPIGLNVSLDYEGFGLMLSPGIINVGQNFYLINTEGGQDGLRRVDLKYLAVPLSLKAHLIHFSAFKFSALATITPSFLLDGTEVLNHHPTKLQFPASVYPILPPDYIIEYDGVLTPEVKDHIIAEKTDFRPMQLFAGLGFRSDWDPSNHWRISVDFRVNYGLFDPRTPDYNRSNESTVRLYDIPGQRRDMFAQFTVGISRYLEFEQSEKERKKKLKGTTKRYQPTKRAGQNTRQFKPRD
jgi:hypothetical protein